MKTIVVCVTSDLATDNRVLRHCELMHEMGLKVLVLGRKLPSSPVMPILPYDSYRVKLPFSQGPLFYLSFQVWLFFFLLFKKADIIWANDLDTVLPCIMVCKMRRLFFTVDAHELFTEVPELRNAPIKRSIWGIIEKHLAVKADLFITVNHSLADYFNHKYGINPSVIRNVPKRINLTSAHTKMSLGIPEGDLVVVIQGSGINKGRGLEETIKAISLLSGVSLLIIGGGNAIEDAKQQSAALGIEAKVHFIKRIPYHEMMRYTQLASIGLAYDTDPCLNFHLALPNKIFDYFHAGIAVISGPQPEISGLVSTYECGYIMKQITPESIQWAIAFYQKHPALLATHQRNSKKASEIEHWEHEKAALASILSPLID
jgi:glycosyltransferase involved in cell wall biosynthesis